MKLSKKAFGLSAGIFSGVGVFFVTNFFIIAGSGGVTLDTLHRLFFGYSFSFLGSIFGLIWGFVYFSIFIKFQVLCGIIKNYEEENHNCGRSAPKLHENCSPYERNVKISA